VSGSFVPNPERVSQINEAVSLWRQGDFALDARWFIHACDPHMPLTEEASQAGSSESPMMIETEVEGVIVTAQSCDIVRECVARPFIEISPLVKVAPDALKEIKNRRRPNYAFVPGAEALSLVADLDRTMTVEKSLLVSWSRSQGCRTEAETREFAAALSRKRARFAFPDDFVKFVRPLELRLREKHDKQTEEGQALRALREILVTADPSWDAMTVSVHFSFIRETAYEGFQGKSWHIHLEKWLSLLKPVGRFTEPSGVVQGLEDLTAQDYVASSRLDLDHLSPVTIRNGQSDTRSATPHVSDERGPK
jgi:hypothetical protein